MVPFLASKWTLVRVCVLRLYPAQPCLLQGINQESSDMAALRSFGALLLLAVASTASAARLPSFSFGSEVRYPCSPDPAPAAIYARKSILCDGSSLRAPQSLVPRLHKGYR